MSITHDDLGAPRGRATLRPGIEIRSRRAVSHAYRALHIAFIVAPLTAGLDKFFDRLVDWSKYLAPQVDAMLPGTAKQFMYGVGVVEIVAGLLVAFAPRIGAYVVAAWLAGIIVNLLIHGGYGDIVLRDIGLMLGAFALGRLADAHHRGELRDSALP